MVECGAKCAGVYVFSKEMRVVFLTGVAGAHVLFAKLCLYFYEICCC